MPLNVKAGGSWRTASKVYAKVAGAWVTAKELWGYMNGGWRSAWKNEIRYINTSNRTAASIFELMGSPTQPNTYIFENQATISAGTGTYALRTGVFPAGSILKIVNKGYIRGKGGNGGAFNVAGGAGSTALYLDMNCTLDNGGGYIYGGGGGGGGARRYYDAAWDIRAGGGGGAGSNAGAAGAANYAGSSSGGNLTINTAPAAGTASAGGAGGVLRATSGSYYDQVNGGAGGGLGVAGGAGTTVVNQAGTSINMKPNAVTTAGGAAGAAVLKNGKTLTITAGNDTTRIRGAVV